MCSAHDAPVIARTSVAFSLSNEITFAMICVSMNQPFGNNGLIGLSTSGNSTNLVKAFVKAREMGVTTFGLAGMNGGEMAKIGLDHCLVVETDSIHRVQECHVTIYHILWDLVHTLLADDRGSLAATPEH